MTCDLPYLSFHSALLPPPSLRWVYMTDMLHVFTWSQFWMAMPQHVVMLLSWGGVFAFKVAICDLVCIAVLPSCALHFIVWSIVWILHLEQTFLSSLVRFASSFIRLLCSICAVV